MPERAYIIETRKTATQSHYSKRERKQGQERSRRTRDMNYMRDDLVSVCTTTPAHSVQQRERRPGRVCRSASRNTYDEEVCHRGESRKRFTLFRIHKKIINQNTWGRGGERRNLSPASDARRTTFSPADISRVQQHALLQRVKTASTGYRIW
jgi:hypothetical protein